MKARGGSWLEFVFPIVLGFCLLETGGPLPRCAAQSAAKPGESKPAIPASPDADEQSALNDAFRTAQGNPQILIKNLEAFLTRFPKSSRRQLVLDAICNYATQANAPGVVVEYGHMLLEITPDDPKLLTLLIDALARQNDPASRTLAIDYSSRLVKIAENQRNRSAATEGTNNTEWAERIAALYARRAGFYRDSGDLDKAFADYKMSYDTYPTALVAEQLGDAELKKGDSARALDYYLTAFAFPDKNPDLVRRQEARRKLGSLYLAQHHSTRGLGDLALAHYDALTPQLAERLSSDQPQNAGRHDPFEFVLERMDGTQLPLAGYRGKVVVMDFWATWCGPCRLQGKLVDQVAQNFRTDSSAVFLSLNVDQDRSGVPAFLKQEGWTLSAAYAQGLDQLFIVTQLPTLIIFDRQGRVVYREEGVSPGTFAEDLRKHVRETLRGPAGSGQ